MHRIIIFLYNLNMKTKITNTLKNTQSTDTQAVKCNLFTNKDLQKQALETMTKATHTPTIKKNV